MTKIVVFDSGMGSLSIIKPLRKLIPSEIIYFADQDNYPYGKKSKSELKKIINKTIQGLERKFSPDFIIIASNTPSLLFNWENQKIITVKPPLVKAVKISKSKNIGILTTENIAKSNELLNYIKKQKFSKDIRFHIINASLLVDLVEQCIFLSDPKICKKIIKKELNSLIFKNKIDVITLSSTHLPFLKSYLINEFKDVQFLDPAEDIILKLQSKLSDNKSKKTFRIFTSDNSEKFRINLKKIGIKHKPTLNFKL
ncbi:MAG: aspartate/glutamate racemase family protein [Nitrosopumilus sp.]|nr:aspartate/glutamate racemase family protein [Nitrosopumilus sp.]